MKTMNLLVLGGIFLAVLISGCTLKQPQNGTNGTGNQSCICTLDYNPVCGVDGKTYGNACGARCAKVEVAYPGECRTCSDSDGGRDVSVKGTASDTLGNNTDRCENGKLMEFYCEAGQTKSEISDCPSGQECKDGACVAKPPPAMTCEQFCPTQPHIECVGTWNISGTYPGCNCGFVCNTQPPPPPPQNQSNVSKSTLRFFSGLQPLSSGHYELWAFFGSQKVSVGKFEFGNDLKFDSKMDLGLADSIAVTIEPEGDSDNNPGVVYLSGEVENGEANLTFGADFGSTNGSYILLNGQTGSSGGKASGIWFMTAGEPRKASLNLPSLPPGWVYEGWVIHKGATMSTGRFTSASGADKSNFYSGSGTAPPFPGEDFLKNAPQNVPFPADLTDGTTKVIISVEPDMNGVDPTGPSPFGIKPLTVVIDDSALMDNNYPFDRNLLAMPLTGDAFIDSKTGDKITCTEFCPAQPHDSCIGSWNITGHYEPDCICQWKCRAGPTD